MNKKSLLLVALAVPAMAFAPKADTVQFAPADGTTVTKTFTNVMKFGLDDMSMLMNGEDSPMMPQMEMDMEMTSTITVTDSYASVSDGHPSKVTRTFDTISQEMAIDVSAEVMGESQDENMNGSGSSELEGLTVVFAWDEEAEEFEVSFAEDGGDEELLTNLVEDMDLRALLPEGEVSEGDTWDIALPGLVDILAPGGDLSLDIDMDGQGMGPGPDPAMMADMREMLADMLEGSATGKYVGTRDVDGTTVGVIELDIEIDTARDMSELIEEMMAEQTEGMEMNIDRVDVEFALETTGELLWDLRGGHVYSLELEGDVAVAMDMEMGMDMGGQELTFEMSMEMSGTLATTVGTE